MLPGNAIDLPDCRSTLFVQNAILRGVAVGADRCVKLRAVRTRDDGLRPVMIDAACRQIDQHCAGCHDVGYARHIREANDSVGISNVKRVTDEGHPEW